MKTTKIGILAIAAIGAGLFGSTVLADATTGDNKVTDKATSADIQINGTLGADNTDPGATIPEGDPAWINVSIPTNTLFYNTAADTAIKSPVYTITNNSGRGVIIGISSFIQTNSATVTAPSDLQLNWEIKKGNSDTVTKTQNLVDGTTLVGTTADVLSLANNEDAVNSKATYTYGGSATATEQVQPSYKLTLSLTAAQKDGTAVPTPEQ